jgi:biofilm PGA synthesis lipoprotein PgaB
MKYIDFVIFISLFLIQNTSALTLVEKKYDRLVGIQIFNFNIEEKNLDNFLDELKESGCNTIFVRVFQNNGDRYHFGKVSDCKSGVYYKNSLVCSPDDVLAKVVKIARKKNIKVYAWMATRTLSFLKEKYGLSKTFKNGANSRKGYGPSMFNDNFIKDINRLFKDLALYDIDGILIQDDFLIKVDEDASRSALHKFYVDYGERISPASNIGQLTSDKWYNWKLEQMLYFISELIKNIKITNPAIKVAINVFYETPINPDAALKWYAQSMDNLLKTGADYFAFMAYYKQIEEELNVDFYNALSLINNGLRSMTEKIKPHSRIIAKLQFRNFDANRSTVNKGDINALCNILNKYGDLSVVMLPFEDIRDKSFFCGNY